MKNLKMLVLALFLLEGTGQFLGGFGQAISNIASLKEPGYDSKVETARWAGHYEYVEVGNDASGMASSG